MTDVPPPPSGTPLAAPPPPADPAAAPPKKGLSTGAKIAIGCGALLLLVVILMFACFGFAAKKVGDLQTSVEDQEEAGRVAGELEREHPFTPPADGTLDEDLVDRFFAATDDAWDEIEPWARELDERSDRISAEGGEAGFGDAMAGVQGMGRARVAIVEALQENDISPSAFVWTGFRLTQAHDAVATGSVSGVPEKNLAIAREHADRLAEMEDRGDEDEFDRGSILGLAFVFFPRQDVMVPPMAPPAP
ncbi:MAG: hypothetical protein ABR599_08320 [Gemmatimonadota bacterium]